MTPTSTHDTQHRHVKTCINMVEIEKKKRGTDFDLYLHLNFDHGTTRHDSTRHDTLTRSNTDGRNTEERRHDF
jgi:hypothetical protein